MSVLKSGPTGNYNELLRAKINSLYESQGKPIDALSLKNFQAAMLANQIPDVGNPLPVIDGIVFSVQADRTTDALTPHTAITNNLATLLTLDNTTPDGTHLLVSISVTANGLVSPSILAGFIIQEGGVTPPAAFANNDYLVVHDGGTNNMIDTVSTLELYVHGSNLLIKGTSPSFFSASVNGRYDGTTVDTYPLTATPTEIISFSCDAAASNVNAAITLDFKAFSVIEL